MNNLGRSSSLPRKKIRKKRKKKKKLREPTETKEVDWRLPTFPFEIKRNEVIIDGKVMTTIDILDVPGKSNAGFEFHREGAISKKCLQQIPSSEMDIDECMKLNEGNDIVDGICKVDRDSEEVDANHTQEDEDNDKVALKVDKIWNINSTRYTDEGCCLDNSSVAASFMMEDLHSRKYNLYFSVIARHINFHRKISIKTRLGYPIAVKMSIKPKVNQLT